MAELPFLQFFPADYLRDTEIHSLSAQGGWMRMLCSMWHPARRGVLSLRLQAMARLLHASEQTTKSIIEEIEDCDVGQVEWSEDGARVTVTCRRIVRDWEATAAAREELSQSKRNAANARWAKQKQITSNADAMHVHSKRNADAMHMECYPETRDQKYREREIAQAREPDAPPSRSIRRPSLDQAKSAAATIGVTAEFADEWWHAREATDWVKGSGGGGSVHVGTNWQADLKTYASRMAGSGNPKPKAQSTELLEWEK